MYKKNIEWEILGSDNNFYDFGGILLNKKKLRYIIVQNGTNFWASNDHIFFQNDKKIKLKNLPKYCKIDGINNSKISIIKTNKYKFDIVYDIVECKHENHQYVINDNIITSNCDELAFVGHKRKDDVAREFWTSISPTLSTGGSCIISSTPTVDTNLFAELWRGAEQETNGFAYMKVLWDKGPGRNEKWKRGEIGRIGLEKFKREHECEFIGNDDLLINGITLSRIKSVPHNNAIKDFKFWDEIVSENSYIVGVDPSTGIGNDYSVIEIFEFPSMVQVAEFRSNTTSSNYLYKALKGILLILERKNCTIYYSIENNGVGEGILTMIESDENGPELAEFISQSNSKRPGFSTTGKTKMTACIKFKEMVESNNLIINSNVLLSECKTYARSGKGYEAKSGGTDDCISAVLICIRVLEEIMMYDDKAYATFANSLEGDYFDDDSYNENSDDAPLPFIL